MWRSAVTIILFLVLPSSVHAADPKAIRAASEILNLEFPSILVDQTEVFLHLKREGYIELTEPSLQDPEQDQAPVKDAESGSAEEKEADQYTLNRAIQIQPTTLDRAFQFLENLGVPASSVDSSIFSGNYSIPAGFALQLGWQGIQQIMIGTQLGAAHRALLAWMNQQGTFASGGFFKGTHQMIAFAKTLGHQGVEIVGTLPILKRIGIQDPARLPFLAQGKNSFERLMMVPASRVLSGLSLIAASGGVVSFLASGGKSMDWLSHRGKEESNRLQPRDFSSSEDNGFLEIENGAQALEKLLRIEDASHRQELRNVLLQVIQEVRENGRDLDFLTFLERLSESRDRNGEAWFTEDRVALYAALYHMSQKTEALRRASEEGRKLEELDEKELLALRLVQLDELVRSSALSLKVIDQLESVSDAQKARLGTLQTRIQNLINRLDLLLGTD